MSTSGDIMSASGDIMSASGDAQYIRGYHDTRRDIMIHVGNTMGTSGGYHEHIGGTS